MTYRRLFDPERVQRFAARAPADGRPAREHSLYVYDDPTVVLAVNVALATGRPLLVRGPSGGGKSTLARNVARTLGRRYYERVISSRTQARDLLWEVDLLWRLQDAQAKELARDLTPYVVPGVLWWAFDRASALAQAARTRAGAVRPYEEEYDPAGGGAAQEDTGRGEGGAPGAGAVVLLDEIDKADPDLPNNLLVPLGSLSFQVDETGEPVGARHPPPLVFVTTNDERELPPAFLRRCVELKIQHPGVETLVAIGRAHFPDTATELLDEVARLVGGAIGAEGTGNPASIAEYLDTVRACVELGILPGSTLFFDLLRATVWKHGRAPAGAIGP